MKVVFPKLPDAADNRFAYNAKSIRCCWPDWEGPKVTAADDPDPAGFASCGSGTVFSITNNCDTWHYCAPFKIEKIYPNGTVEGVISYEGDTHCTAYNGERIRVPLDCLWPPTGKLWEKRYAEELAEGLATGATCQCGSLEIVSVYGGGFTCQPCHQRRHDELQAQLKPKKKKTAKKAAKKKAK